MNDQEFFSHFSDYLEDGLPEAILQDKSIVQRILNIMMGENPQLNFNVLSILRAWCRKMEIRIRIEDDDRIQINAITNLREIISPFCIQFAISASSFFKNTALLPLACITCQELIALAHIPTPDIVIDKAMEQIHIKSMRISLLELVANSEKYIEGLPIFDPTIIFQYPTLHRSLLNLSSPEDIGKYKKAHKVYKEIQQIDNAESDYKRDLIQFCKIDTLFNRAPASVFAGYPHPKVRKLFYQYVLKKRIDITQFSDTLICCGLFDPIVKDDAMKILKIQFDCLKDGEISHSQIAHLQCIEVKQKSKFIGKLCNFINAADDFTTLCSWLRFLYHKEPWIKDQTYKHLSEMLPFDMKIDLNEQPFEDHFVNKYKKYLSTFTKCVENPLAESLFETVLSDEQADFIKDIAASKLIEVLLDPSQGIKKYLTKLRSLSFSKYPKLLHALSVRDGSWRISNVERLFQLISSITIENSMDLLPILARTVFQPLLIYEGNGASLLKLPFFAEDVFHIKGNGGFVDTALYEPIDECDFSDILNEWVHYKPIKSKPICDGFNIPTLISLCICDPILSADLLCQLDNEESATSKLMTVGQPAQIIYLLLIAVLCAKMPSKAASKMCEKYVETVPSNAMKLNQALIEFGGECQLPERITEFILDQNLRRTAISLVTVHMQFHKNISSVNIKKILHLLEDDLPINIRRQLTLMFVNVPKGEYDNDFTQQKDSIIKSLAFHTAAVTDSHFDDAIETAFNCNLAVCSRASALEFIVDYFVENGGKKLTRDFSPLYLETNQENLFSFQLLRLLSIPQIRKQLLSYEEFILSFITPSSSPLFANAALISLIGYNFSTQAIAHSIMSLASKKEYLHNILLIISQLSIATLQFFDSILIQLICRRIREDDIYLEFVCINHLLISGIEFPPNSMSDLLSVYNNFLDSSSLHEVLSHIFSLSYDCRIMALKSGFLSLARNELVMYGENQARFRLIWRSLSCFVYDFPEGQNSLLDLWTIDTLTEFFDTSETMLKFYLCYSYKNEVTQNSFEGPILDLIFDEFDKTRVSPPLLLKLIASILNSQKVRRKIYRQKRVQRFLPRLNYSVSHKEWKLCEGMLHIIYTLCRYEDGCEELFEKNRITDVFLLLLSNENVMKIPIFSILIKNLKANNVTWKALTFATRKSNIDLLDKLVQIGDENQCPRQKIP